MKFAKIAFVSELRTIFLSLSNFWKLIKQPCPNTMEPPSSQSTLLALLPIIEARIVKIGAWDEAAGNGFHWIRNDFQQKKVSVLRVLHSVWAAWTARWRETAGWLTVLGNVGKVRVRLSHQYNTALPIRISINAENSKKYRMNMLI